MRLHPAYVQIAKNYLAAAGDCRGRSRNAYRRKAWLYLFLAAIRTQRTTQ